jgi:hypothetical protein
MSVDPETPMSQEAWVDAFVTQLRRAAALTGNSESIELAQEFGPGIAADYYDDYLEHTFDDPVEAASFEVACWSYAVRAH